MPCPGSCTPVPLVWPLLTSCCAGQDFSDLVAQKASQQKRKAEQAKQTQNKKQKESFKF